MSDEIVEIELVFGDFLRDTACFRFVVLLLRAFYEAHHITHTEDTVSHTTRMEHIQCLHLLACSDELDRLVDHRADTQRRTTAGITIQFSQYDAVKIQTVIKLFGGIHGILTGHSVHHEQSLGRLDRFLDSCYLGHHLLVYSQTTGRIDDHHIIAELAGLRYRVLRLFNGIRLLFRSIDFCVDLLAKHAQLLDSSGAIHVARYEHHFLILLCLKEISQL